MRHAPVKAKTLWLGGGVIAALLAGPISGAFLTVVSAFGLPVASDLEWVPPAMLFLWGSVFAFVMGGPGAFALGAMVGHALAQMGIRRLKSLPLALGGAAFGAVYAVLVAMLGVPGYSGAAFALAGAATGLLLALGVRRILGREARVVDE